VVETITQPITVVETITVPGTITLPAQIITVTEYVTRNQVVTLVQQIPITISVPETTTTPVTDPVTDLVVVSGTSTIAIPEVTLDTFNLTLQKSDGGGAATPGAPLVYTLVYANPNTIDARQVVITETVPRHTHFDPELSTKGWSCRDGGLGGTDCIYSVGSLPAGEHGGISFAVIVDRFERLGNVDALQNDAKIDDIARNSPPETNEDDNWARSVTTIAVPTALKPTLEGSRIYWRYLPFIAR